MTRRLPDVMVLGIPDDRRLRLLGEAIRSEGYPPPRVVAWLEFLRDPRALSQALREGGRLRIESPSDDFETWRELVALGADARHAEGGPTIGATHARALALDHGRVYLTRQWYLGLCTALDRVAAIAEKGRLTVENHPDAIRTCFDKALVHRRLEAAGVAHPALRRARCFDELAEEMRAAGWTQAFVKPRHGSTACGVVALRLAGARAAAWTTLEPVRSHDGWRFYSSYRVRGYHQLEDVVRVTEFALGEGAVVERWLPKLTIGPEAVDLRVLVLEDQHAHVVARGSRTPITNLHLRNRRLDPSAVSGRVGEDAWTRGLAAAVNASRACGCSYAGVDLLFDVSGRHAVAEVNAFGDLLPRLLHDGCDVYTAQVRRWAEVA